MRKCPFKGHGIRAGFSLWISVRIIQCGVCILSLMLESKLDCLLFRRVWCGLVLTCNTVVHKKAMKRN